jgi:hypothetical protein
MDPLPSGQSVPSDQVRPGYPHLRSIALFHARASWILSGVSWIDQGRFFAVKQNVSTTL